MNRNEKAGGSDHFEVEDNQLAAAISGVHDAHLAILEEAFAARIDARGNRFVLTGSEEARARALGALAELREKAKKGDAIDIEDARAAARYAAAPAPRPPGESDARLSIKTHKRLIEPRSPNQADYLRKLSSFDLTFGVGPAGTGKTYLAVAHAVGLLMREKVERIILSRPALEAGERIGFLPGTKEEKLDPFLRPLYDALNDMLRADFMQRRMEAGVIEIAPIAFMRGRTLARAAVILDEAQNATPEQMKMFLTRLGEGAHMAITGDPTQTDLPAGQRSGLADALAVLSGVEGVAETRFTAGDVVRHPLVARIIRAYEARATQGRGA